MVFDGQLYDGQAVHPVGAPEIISQVSGGFESSESIREPPHAEPHAAAATAPK